MNFCIWPSRDHRPHSQVVWPSAYRAWGLIGGAKVHVDSSLVNPRQRQKRVADDAFGTEERRRAGLLPQTLDFTQSTDVAAPQASAAGDRLLAHMLGIDFPLAGQSTSYTPEYEWWLRDQNQSRSPDSSQPVSPSPGSGSNHSSPSAAMPIPFSFDQARNFWDPRSLQDMGVNFATGA